jgi:hypothetical protein
MERFLSFEEHRNKVAALGVMEYTGINRMREQITSRGEISRYQLPLLSFIVADVLRMRNNIAELIYNLHLPSRSEKKIHIYIYIKQIWMI